MKKIYPFCSFISQGRQSYISRDRCSFISWGMYSEPHGVGVASSCRIGIVSSHRVHIGGRCLQIFNSNCLVSKIIVILYQISGNTNLVIYDLLLHKLSTYSGKYNNNIHVKVTSFLDILFALMTVRPAVSMPLDIPCINKVG